MAAYFPKLRRQPRLDAVREESTRAPQTTYIGPMTAEEDRRWLANTSILIFPSPPSSVPPTPASTNAPMPASPTSGSMSNFSLPTSISIESNLESASEQSTPSLPRHIRLRRAAPQMRGEASPSSPEPPGAHEVRDRWRKVYSQKLEMELESVSEATGPEDPAVEVWEWSSIQASPSEAFPEPQDDSDFLHRSGIELWASHLRTRTTSQWTQATDITNATRLTYFSHSTPERERIITQTPVHFPFLASILKLLRIDPETVLLLGVFGQPSTAETNLFPSSPYDLNDSYHEKQGKEGPSKTNPVIALLRQTTADSTPSASTYTVKEGIRAAADCDLYATDGIVLSFPPNLPFSIQDVLLSPITLTKAVATGTFDLTAGALIYSSSAVGSALGAVRSVVGGGIWRRAEPAVACPLPDLDFSVP